MEKKKCFLLLRSLSYITSIYLIIWCLSDDGWGGGGIRRVLRCRLWVVRARRVAKKKRSVRSTCFLSRLFFGVADLASVAWRGRNK